MEELNTRKWRQREMNRIKGALPDGVAFGSLSTSSKTSFELELETPVDATEVSELAEATETALAGIGIPVKDIRLGSGYSGAMNPGVVLRVRMDA